MCFMNHILITSLCFNFLAFSSLEGVRFEVPQKEDLNHKSHPQNKCINIKENDVKNKSEIYSNTPVQYTQMNKNNVFTDVKK